MTAQHTNAGRAQRQRAAWLGCALATSTAVGSAALLWWSLRGLVAAHRTFIPVAEGVVLLTGITAGIVAAGLAYAAGLGALALHRSNSPEDPRPALRIAPRLASRSAAILLVLAVSAPAAHAEVSTYRPEASTSSAALISPVGVTAKPHSAGPILSAREDGDIGGSNGSVGPQPSPTTSPSPVPLPGWQSTRAPRNGLKSDAPEPDEIVVKRGDTLWGIAATDLGPGASAAQIAAHWPRWYEANRLMIGPDPDLILPGHILQPPTTTGEQP